jgi:hypothetical protein
LCKNRMNMKIIHLSLKSHAFLKIFNGCMWKY